MEQIPREAGPVVTDLYLGVYDLPSPLWMRAEYLHAWIRDSALLPPLVSTSPAGTPQEAAGVLGQPGTQVLFGEEAFGGEARGVRGTFGLRLGHYFDRLAEWQVETTLMWLGSTERPNDFATDTADDPILARPFLDTSNDAHNALLVGYPNEVTGVLSAEVTSEMKSACILFRRIVHGDDCWRLDLLAGYRYFNYSERLAIEQTSVSVADDQDDRPPVVFLEDRIRVDNRFDGCELGLLAEYGRNAWRFEALGKLAVGQVRQTRRVDGRTFVDPGEEDVPAREYNYGLLATPDGIGRSSRGDIAVLPELNLTVRRYITPEFLFSFGYTLIFLNDATRLADSIDTRVDARDLDPFILLARQPGTNDAPTASPANRARGLWIHGMHLGLEW